MSASAPWELLWVGSMLLSPTPKQYPNPEALSSKRGVRIAEQLRSFWGDGISGGVAEFVIMADQADQLFSTDLSTLLDSPPVTELDPSQLALRSEDPLDRSRMIERLTILKKDPGRRRRYAAILRDLWEMLRPEWEAVGLPRVLAGCAQLTEQLGTGAPLEEAVPVIAALGRKSLTWRAMVDEAAEQGRLAVVPGYFGGEWSLWDLPRHVVVGFHTDADPLGPVREAGRRLAPRLRALGDPTRLDLLLYLANRPTSVGELAKLFGLAQPTVSAHLRSLRDASLVTGRRSAGRTIYQVDQAQLRQLLNEVGAKAGAGRD
ncbi:MAG: ArsR/SmtB family transcription factor [Candidatus Dormibacteria bacterium]